MISLKQIEDLRWFYKNSGPSDVAKDAPGDVLWLLDEVERLQKELEAATQARNLAQDMAKQLMDTLASGRF